MFGMVRWDQEHGSAQGRITAVEHVKNWTPSDRNQVARVAIEDGRSFTLIGDAPEEFFIRRPRKRPVDRDDVAGLKVSDYISFSYMIDPTFSCPHVTGLVVNPEWAPPMDQVAS